MNTGVNTREVVNNPKQRALNWNINVQNEAGVFQALIGG